MTGAWRCVVVASMAYVVLGCPQRGRNATEAGIEADQDGTAGVANAPVSVGASAAVPPLASSEPAHKNPGSRCPAGEVAILLQPGEESCVVECKSNAGCPPAWACDGDGVLSHNGRPGTPIQFCRIANRVKGPDAGHLPTATPTATAPARVDASSPAAQPSQAGPPAKKLDAKMVSGQCPTGYGACGVGCRLKCSKDADCGIPTAHCRERFCLGPNAQPCAK